MIPLKKIILVFSIPLILQSCTLFSAAGFTSQGQPTKEVQGDLKSISTSEEIVNHSQWDALLKKYVNDEGLVNYKGFQKDRAELQSYLGMLSKQNPNDSWSVQELLAYYINTYNAYTVELILENYPVKSIKNISGPWTKGIIPIGENTLSLGGIENSILRKMNEPRIHFAINCASFSCPNILDEAFVASRINEQLERVTKGFINSNKNDLNAQNPKLSSIFDWYKKDFKVNGEVDVIGFINQYANTKINASATIDYKNYDWNLNEQ